MQRRDFLKHGAFAAAAFTTTGRLAHAGTRRSEDTSAIDARQPGHRLGLSLAAYSFRQALTANPPTLDLAGFIDLCARHRLDATELTSYYFRDTSPAHLAQLKRRATVNGLAISGVPVGNDFCHDEPEKRERDVTHVQNWIRHASTLGAQTMRIFAGHAPQGVSLAEAQERCIAELQKVAAFAGDHGIVLAIENHGGITATAEQLLTLVRTVNSPWLGVNLDTGNFHQDPYAEMEQVAPYAVACQVKIHVRGPDGKSQSADFPRIVGILRQAAYRGYVALEYEGGEDPFTAVPEHLAALRDAVHSSK